MDIFELLKRDHEEMIILLMRIQGDHDRLTYADMFEKIEKELLVHSKVEETLFYPFLKNAEITKDFVKISYQEHEEVKSLLGEIGTLEPGSGQWLEAMKTLQVVVAHHMKEEENDLFPKAHKVIDRERAGWLGDQCSRMKEELLSH